MLIWVVIVLSIPGIWCSQRADGSADPNDFEVCKRYNIDNTGIFCKFYVNSIATYLFQEVKSFTYVTFSFFRRKHIVNWLCFPWSFLLFSYMVACKIYIESM